MRSEERWSTTRGLALGTGVRASVVTSLVWVAGDRHKGQVLLSLSHSELQLAWNGWSHGVRRIHGPDGGSGMESVSAVEGSESFGSPTTLGGGVGLHEIWHTAHRGFSAAEGVMDPGG